MLISTEYVGRMCELGSINQSTAFLFRLGKAHSLGRVSASSGPAPTPGQLADLPCKKSMDMSHKIPSLCEKFSRQRQSQCLT
jgi:hypothetical protein